MASTYSEYLRLELIGTGEQTGTWGDTTNTNLGTLLDQAVAGTATIDVTLGDVTLTALNGASDQSRQAILKITGTPVAARNVIAPEQSKWYLVSNDCGQTITLKGSSTTGYAIADGETLLMFWNGTDFVPGSSTALGYTPVNKAGDTMSGALYLPSATPTLSTQAATKGYVDAAVSGAVGSNFVLKTGDTMTGPLVLSGAPSTSLQAATKGYVDSSISGAGYATESWVTSQNYANTTTQALQYYYTKTDSDSRYVSVSTQNLQYYPLTTTVAASYLGINATAANSSQLGGVAASGYVATTGTQTVSGTKNYTAVQNFQANGSYNFYHSITGYVYNSIYYGATSAALADQGYVFAYKTPGSNSFTATYSLYGDGTAYKPGGGTWTASSDNRLKSNVKPLTGALQKIASLRPVTYSWRLPNTEPTTGFIAQEVEQVIPTAVNRRNPTEAEKPYVADKVLGVGWQNDMIAYLVGAIQELKAEVDALKAAK